MNKINISIGIPAFNEERNISSLLNSILLQKEDEFTIKEIIVISDCSNDSTAEKVLKINDSRIKLIIGKTRKGKQQRLNQIFQISKGNIIVLLDADIVLSSNDVISNLIHPFTKSSKLGLTCGWGKPVKAKSFVEACVNASRSAYDDIKINYKNGNSVLSCEGRILALSKKLALQVNIPKGVIADDIYLYFTCITHNLRYKFVKKAVIWYRSPSLLKDQIKQNSRFITDDRKLRSIFGSRISDEYQVPKMLFYQALLKTFIKMPIYSLGIFLINLYCTYRANKLAYQQGPIWEIATTTKGVIRI